MNAARPLRSGQLPLWRGQLQSGFTLIELMISVAIGLLLVAALIGLFLSLSRSNRELAKTNTQIENGRLAMQLLQNDLEHVGFWGTFVPQYDDLTRSSALPPTDAPTALPDPCLAYTATNWNSAYKTNLIGIPVQAYDVTSPAPAVLMPGTTCDSLLLSPKSATDILVTRHAETCVPGVGNCDADSAGKLYFQASLCENEINATPSLQYVLDTTGFTLKKRGCTGLPPAVTVGTPADKRRLISNIYYIRDYSVTAGDGIPTLMRSSLDLVGTALGHQAAVPLISGIEGFRIEFGIDRLSKTGIDVISDALSANHYDAAIQWTDAATQTTAINRGDGIPDGAYVRCTTAAPCSFAQMTNVVAAKIYLLARTEETVSGYTDTKKYTLGSTTVGPFNDHYQRHVFSTVVRMTNVSGRRETP